MCIGEMAYMLLVKTFIVTRLERLHGNFSLHINTVGGNLEGESLETDLHGTSFSHVMCL